MIMIIPLLMNHLFHILSDGFGSQTNSITYILYHIKVLFRFLFLMGALSSWYQSSGLHIILLLGIPNWWKQYLYIWSTADKLFN